MQVGTRIRITLHGESEDFLVTHVHNEDIYAASVLDTNRVIRMKLYDGELSMPEVPEAVIYAIYALTGNPNLNVRVLAKVDDAVLNAIAELDAGIKTLVHNNDIWYAKVEIDFGEEVLRFKPQDVSAQDFYKSYEEIQIHGAPAALLAAAETGDLTMVKIALNAGADVNVRDEFGNTALMLSSWRGHVPIVHELIRRAADVNAHNMSGYTALLLAIDEVGSLEVVQELLRAGADADIIAENRTALMLAFERGHPEIAHELIQHGADIHRADRFGGTPLYWAASKGYIDILRDLIQRGVNVNAVVSASREYALLLAAMRGHLQTVQELLRAGADVNAVNADDGTALMYASIGGHLKIVQELLAHGAAVNAVDEHGVTALMYAADNGNLELVNELIQAGADVNAVDAMALTPRMWALRRGHRAVADVLRQRGAR